MPDCLQAGDRVAVLAPGVVGGSLLYAIRRRFPQAHVSAYARRPEVRDQVDRVPGLVDRATCEISEAVKDARLIILAMPTRHMAAAVAAMPGDLSGAVVTDVGSVKGPVVAEIEPLVADRGGKFCGSHPMAGSEQTGFAAARESMFDGASVILTPSEDGGALDAAEYLEQFWAALGGRVSRLSPPEHDRVIAQVSHLPHVVAAAVVRVASQSGAESLAYCGGGFRDTTRVAAGPSAMWADILLDNQDAVLAALADLKADLDKWQSALEVGSQASVEALLASAEEVRQSLRIPDTI